MQEDPNNTNIDLNTADLYDKEGNKFQLTDLEKDQ